MRKYGYAIHLLHSICLPGPFFLNIDYCSQVSLTVLHFHHRLTFCSYNIVFNVHHGVLPSPPIRKGGAPLKGLPHRWIVYRWCQGFSSSELTFDVNNSKILCRSLWYIHRLTWIRVRMCIWILAASGHHFKHKVTTKCHESNQEKKYVIKSLQILLQGVNFSADIICTHKPIMCCNCHCGPAHNLQLMHKKCISLGWVLYCMSWDQHKM